jgi:hypothetical protein
MDIAFEMDEMQDIVFYLRRCKELTKNKQEKREAQSLIDLVNEKLEYLDSLY